MKREKKKKKKKKGEKIGQANCLTTDLKFVDVNVCGCVFLLFSVAAAFSSFQVMLGK